MTIQEEPSMSDSAGARPLPDYDSLPEAGGGARSGWGLFGSEDNVGLLNLQTSQVVAEAARLVRSGRVFPLDLPVDFFGPADSPTGRGAPVHNVRGFRDVTFDDRLDGFFPQGATQWDALAHVGFEPGAFYNGVTPEQIASGERNTIDHWARRGIVGRAVLLDVERLMAAQGRELDPFGDYGITVADLEATRKMAGVEYQPGDVILVRTGHVEAVAALPAEQRRIPYDVLKTPGLGHTEEIARYIWNTHASAVAADNMSLEVWPAGVDLGADPTGPGWPFGFSHNVWIGLFGLCVGEYFWLADLAAECERDGRYEMFLCSSPLHLPGGIGSPASAIAIK
jgi:hypothetical protein